LSLVKYLGMALAGGCLASELLAEYNAAVYHNVPFLNTYYQFAPDLVEMVKGLF